MNFLVDVFIFISGLVFGSFANVCIYRLPKKISLITPTSFCPECREKIFWYDNIPVLSFLILRGRCRFCHKKISFVYPVIEMATGFTFLAVKIKFWPDVFSVFFWCLFFLILLIVAGIDFSTRTIPDVFSLGLIPLGLIFSPMNHFLGANIPERIVNSFSGFLVNGLFIYLVALLSTRIYQKEALGGGDIKLVAGMATFLGVGAGFFLIFWAALVGSVIVSVLLIMKKVSRRDYFPFGPFLVLGAYIVVFIPQSVKVLTFA